MNKHILENCPVCGCGLDVTEYSCSKCDVTIRGRFKLDLLSGLSNEDAEFVRVFLSAHGSIKEVERILGISYPTVKSRLDKINVALGNAPDSRRKKKQIDILESIERGEIEVEVAIEQLQKNRSKD